MAAFQGGISAAPGVDLRNMDTPDLVLRHQVAKNKCAEPIARRDDEGSIIDYVPVVAVYNLLKDTSEEDAAANRQYAQDLANRKAWCQIRDEAAAELTTRKPTDVAASTKVAHQRAIGGKAGAVFSPRPQEQIPGVTDIVLADVSSGLQKLNPLYWLGRAYDSVMGSVGLGEVQSPLDRLFGLLRLLLYIAAGVGVAVAISIIVRSALGFGLQTQRQLISAAPQLTKLAK